MAVEVTMILYTDQLARLRQSELRSEAEASRCCRPLGARRAGARRARRRHVNGADAPTRPDGA